MKQSALAITALLIIGLVAPTARGDSFAEQLNLKPLETLTVQYRQTLKTFDSFSRETLAQITGKSSFEGQSALYTILDMSFRPEEWVNRDVVRIRHVPLRKDLQMLENIPQEEKDRIVREGKVSFAFLFSRPVNELLVKLNSTAVAKSSSINELYGAASVLESLFVEEMPLLRIIPPATNNADDHVWHNIGTVAQWGKHLRDGDQQRAEGFLAYGSERGPMLGEAGQALLALRDAWKQRNATEANRHIEALATILPKINPDRYPSHAKRKAEVVYNRLARLTIPGAAFYFIAFALFLMSARSGVNALRLWGLRLFVLAFVIHTAGIGIRWWLVTTQVGNWFESIPIKNQFESVLFAAWFGCLVGLIFEMRRPRGIFGASASFVGWLALIAIFAAPFISGRDIGGNINHSAGVLMSYWLYIHVTLVVASYALIGMSFLLSIWWLVRYYMTADADAKLHERQVSDDNVAINVYAGGGGGATASIGMMNTLARLLFIPLPRAQQVQAAPIAVAADLPDTKRNFLATLDLCNLVILQLAFWVLGVGIVCGAIWADMSWGRPWGWDPKETFALVTWIVYLVIVHVRVATLHKAWWTALLSIVGFAVMLFNWIGVNFFLVGLHSYA
jgi:cytochrome c-type biogenesis protein CcsB